MSHRTTYSGHRQGCPTIRTDSLTTTANALAAVAGRLGQAVTLQITRIAWLVFATQADLDAWRLMAPPQNALDRAMQPLGLIVVVDAADLEQLAAPPRHSEHCTPLTCSIYCAVRRAAFEAATRASARAMLADHAEDCSSRATPAGRCDCELK